VAYKSHHATLHLHACSIPANCRCAPGLHNVRRCHAHSIRQPAHETGETTHRDQQTHPQRCQAWACSCLCLPHIITVQCTHSPTNPSTCSITIPFPLTQPSRPYSYCNHIVPRPHAVSSKKKVLLPLFFSTPAAGPPNGATATEAVPTHLHTHQVSLPVLAQQRAPGRQALLVHNMQMHTRCNACMHPSAAGTSRDLGLRASTSKCTHSA
jgi:hypothetical protein